MNIKTRNRLEIKFSIQLTSVFNDEQTAVRRKEYLAQPTIRPQPYYVTDGTRQWKEVYGEK